MLRTLRTICAVLAASVLGLAVATWLMLRSGRPPDPRLPSGALLGIVLLAIVLILLASRLRAGMLRRAARPAPHPGGPPEERAVAAAYSRATLLTFALLEAAALVGFALAVLTASARYGLVLYAASLVSMLVRWPREAELARLIRRRAVPA